MNLRDYLGKYIKVYTQNSGWFICKPFPNDDESYRSDESKILIVVSENSPYEVGEMYVEHTVIERIEELDLNIHEGLRQTLHYVPDVKNAYQSTDVSRLPKRVVFGKND